MQFYPRRRAVFVVLKFGPVFGSDNHSVAAFSRQLLCSLCKPGIPTDVPRIDAKPLRDLFPAKPPFPGALARDRLSRACP